MTGAMKSTEVNAEARAQHRADVDAELGVATGTELTAPRHTGRRRLRRGTREALWVARAVAGPAVWFVLLCASLAIAPPAHEVRHRGVLLGLHALAAVLAAAPGLSAYRDLRRIHRSGIGAMPAERERFLAGGALALSALAVLLVIASVAPVVLLAPGAEP
jgi:hypothetical protein